VALPGFLQTGKTLYVGNMVGEMLVQVPKEGGREGGREEGRKGGRATAWVGAHVCHVSYPLPPSRTKIEGPPQQSPSLPRC
jgi:hypothetical protein